MEDAAVQVGWSAEQWRRVAEVVTEEVSKASVATAILACYGPIPEGMDAVRRDKISVKETGGRLAVTVEDTLTTPMWSLEVHVRLRREQVRDESLSSGSLAFRRAANLLAMVQDAIVFHGGPQSPDAYAGEPVAMAIPLGPGPNSSLVKQVVKPDRDIAPGGLVASGAANNPDLAEGAYKKPPKEENGSPEESDGESLVSKVQNAISTLDGNRHSGPFTCVLGNKAFFAAHQAKKRSSVLPVTQMEGLLQRPVLRSGSLAANLGVVLAASAEPFDLVVGTPPEVQFLQVESGEDYAFRVYERFVLRIKDPTALYTIEL
jgi:uncharacterized linocin/CFP29 family protein